jgi:hypothetical protein
MRVGSHDFSKEWLCSGIVSLLERSLSLLEFGRLRRILHSDLVVPNGLGQGIGGTKNESKKGR